MSNSLQPHGLEQARLPCHSPSPEVCSNSCPLNWWRHPTISCSVVPFSSCLQSFPVSGSFPMSWLFTSGDQSIGASHQSFQCIFSVNFFWDWLVLSPCYPRDSQESSPSSQLESINYSMLSLLYVYLSYPYMATRKIIALTIQTFVNKVITLLFSMLSRFVIAFLPRNMIHDIRSCDLMLLASSDENTELLGEWIQVFPTFSRFILCHFLKDLHQLLFSQTKINLKTIFAFTKKKVKR